MKNVKNIAYYILAIALTFGSVNPFNVQVDESVIGEQQGYTPYLLIICVILSLFDKGIREEISYQSKFIYVLLSFDIIVFLSGLFYNISMIGETTYFVFKLISCQVGFVVFCSTFVRYPNILKHSLRLYQLSCSVIILLYIGGFLSSMMYVSKGRLFLFGINPNTYSFMMGLGLLFALNNLLHESSSTLWKAVDVISLLLTSIYIILSGSRGTFLFCGLAACILIGKSLLKKCYLIIPLLFFGFIFGSKFLSNSNFDISMFERLEELRGGDEREELTDHAIEIFKGSPIIIGIGNVGYTEESLRLFHDARDSHNMLVSSLVLSGLLGFCLLCKFLYLLFNQCRLNRFKNKLAIALFIYMFLISLKTGWVITYALMWYVFAITAALNLLTTRESLQTE